MAQSIPAQADYVIVGGGSAGCVLASRLSENPAHSVILIEAGTETHRFWIDLPTGLRKLIGNPATDWCYATEPDPSIGGRALGWHGGKVLGGSSAINGGIFIRGSKKDYDAWSEQGCQGWSFDELLPYFMRSENWQSDPRTQSHGSMGPLGVSPVRSPHPLTQAFISACASEGARVLDDHFGGDQDGAFLACTNQRNGRREDAGKAFLKRLGKRANLTILTGLAVQRVTFESRRATGVELADGRKVSARREVILSAGTIQSPTILMRSGVGPARLLGQAGVPVLHDSPEVGENLREHPLISLGKYVSVPTYNVQMGAFNLARQFAKYVLRGCGMLTSPAAHAMAMMRSDPARAEPDLQLFFSPMLIVQERDASERSFSAFSSRPGVRISTYVCRPQSKGRLRLNPADPNGRPVIEPRMLSDSGDLATLVRGARLIERLAKAPGLAEYVTGDAEDIPTDDDALAEFVRENVGIGFHPVGTCRMAQGVEGVVDPRLRVNGVEGLRVVDASIMPTLVSANTLAAALMIGEKGAEMIAQDWSQAR